MDNLKDVDTFLEHFGVKGMHWGIRNKRSRRAAARILTKSRPSDEGKAAAQIRSKQKIHGTKSLTNQELRNVTARTKLEQEFERLHPKEKSKLDKGDAFVKKVLGYTATANSVYAALNTPAGKLLLDKGKRKALGTGLLNTPLANVTPKPLPLKTNFLSNLLP